MEKEYLQPDRLPADEGMAATAGERAAEQKMPDDRIPEQARGELPKSPKKRLISIELCRIVCMLLVIFNHTLNQFYGVAGGAGYFAKYVNFINICAVGTFLIISGFFMFGGEFSYTNRLKKLLFEVLIPFAVILVCILLYRSYRAAAYWNADFFENLWTDCKELAKEILAWGLVGEYGYLWFVLAYTEIIVLYPVWYLLCKTDKPNTVARRVVIALSLASVAADNIVHIFALTFPVRIFSLINVNYLFVLLGYELKILYLSGKLQGKRCGLWGFIAYLAGVLLGMAFVSVEMFMHNSFSWYRYYLQTIPAIVSAVGLFVFFLNIKMKEQKLVYLIARAGMYIYLIQSPIHVILIDQHLNLLLFPHLGVFSYIVVFLVCAAASFLIGTAVEFIVEKLRYGQQKKSTKKV